MSARPIVSFLPGSSLATPIGGTRNITLRFDNQPDAAPGGDVGYYPYVDLRIPTLGADGVGTATDDGLTYIGATYLGIPLEQTILTFDSDGKAAHPFAKDALGNAIVVTGAAGEQLVVLRLPFGSFTPDQTPTDIVVQVAVSDLADLDTPLRLEATGGFAYGRDALNNPLADAPVRGATASLDVTPQVITLETRYLGPEQETATGPSYARTWVAQADIAVGQTVTGLVLQQVIPDGVVILGTSIANGTGSIAIVNGVVTATFTGDYTGGGAKPTLNVDFYVTEAFAAGGNVLDPVTGAFRPLEMNASLAADWQPVDTRDGPVHFDINPPGAENTITAKSIAVQKSVAVVDSLKAGGHLQWTLDGQVSNYFDVDQLVLTDTLGDGQRFDTGFTPTIVVEEGGETILAKVLSVGQYNFARDPSTGLTTITFDVSKALRDAGLDEALNGGTALDPNKATAKVVFRSVLEESWVGPTPGDDRVDQGDPIGNGVAFSGQVAETDRPIRDESGAGVTLPVSTVSKAIALVNGAAPMPQANGKVNVSSGDEITYRLTLDMPLTGAHKVALKDYLPLPVLLAGDADANAVTAASMTFTVGTPGAGQFTFGPADTYHLLSGAAAPQVTIDAASNALTFNFGDVQDPNYAAGKIDILFTVKVLDAPFGDGLLLTNQVTSTETNSFNAVSESNAIVQFVLGEPRLQIHKAVVATDAIGGVYTGTDGPATFNAPGTTGARFTGNVTSAGIQADRLNNELGKVDAGDKVTFAVVVENKGSGLHGAFDVLLRDVIPAGFQAPDGAGLNLRVTDGNGNALSYTNVGGGFFDPNGGIRLDDAPGQGAIAAYSATNGKNIVVISYDLQLANAVDVPNFRLPNTATIVDYAAQEAGVDRTNAAPASELNATSAVVTAPLEISKTVFATDQLFTGENLGNKSLTDLAIGETVTYRIAVRVPEGKVTDLRVEDFLPKASSGLLDYVSSKLVSVGSNLSGVALGIGAAGAVTDSNADSVGDTVRFNLGNVTNQADNQRTDDDLVVFEVVARVADRGGNNGGDVLRNTAEVSAATSGGRSTAGSSVDVEVVEPKLVMTKSVTANPADAGDLVTYTITMTNQAGTYVAPAFDLKIKDLLSNLAPDVVFQAGTVQVSGTGTSGVTILDGNDTGDTAVEVGAARIDAGGTLTVTFKAKVSDTVVTGKQVTNTAQGGGDTLPDQNGIDRDIPLTASTTLNIAPPKIAKSVVGTSDADTGSSRLDEGVTDLKIGEVVTYEIRVTIPEGSSPNLNVVDLLPDVLSAAVAGGRLVYVANSAQVVSTGANLSGASLATPTITVDDSSTNGTLDRITFSFGNVTNAPDGAENGKDQIVVRLQAQVVDALTNVNGDVLTNTATVTAGSAALQSAPVNVELVEPVLLMDKTASFANGTVRDAGAEVTYTLVIRHANNSNLNAYDLAIRDAVPANLAIIPNSLTSTSGTASFNGQNLSLNIAQLDLGQTVKITYKAVLKDSVTPGEQLINTARVDYDNRAGEGGRGSSAADTETVTVALNPTLTKVVTNTSLAGTGTTFGNDVRPDLAIGETVTYRLIATVGEGTQKLLITDTMPVGLQVLSAQVESIGGKISGGLLSVGSGATSIVGQLVSFDFGTVKNEADNLVNAGDRVSVLVTARVVDGAATTNGAVLTNAGKVETSAPDGTTGKASGTANAPIDIVRPVLTLDKATPFTGGDAGDLVTYTLTINHAGSSRAPAYDAKVTDLLPAGAVLLPGSVTAPAGTSVAVSGNGLTVWLPEGYAPGSGAITITYQAKLADTVFNGQPVSNTASLTYSTAPAGTSGRATITVADDATVPVKIVDAFDKQIVSTSYAATTGNEVAIGETITYRLVATLGEGTQKLVLSDVLPNGLQYVSSKVISTGGVSGSLLSADSAGAYDATAKRVSFDFGALTNTGDNVQNANDQVIVEVVAKVTTAGIGLNIANSGRLQASTPGGTPMPMLTDSEVVKTVALPLASLGDRVFDDLNGNGIQDGGEVGLADVLVRLLNADGTPTGQTTTTSGNGTYGFANLRPGTYKVEFVTQAGYTFSPADRGGDDARDSDADPMTGRTGDVMLDPGENDLTVDAGMLRLGSIAGRVFTDQDADGQRETGDGPVTGVTVRLLNGDGTPAGRTTTTAADGTYKFDGLIPGTYKVEFVKPDGTVFTPKGQGAAATDSDAGIADGRTDGLSLAPGENKVAVDAGIYLPVSLTGRVFTDMDADGQRELGDGPVTGITVRLLDGLGNPAGRTTTTLADGTYTFDGLVPGSYAVEFVKPDGTRFTLADRGADTTDSDANEVSGRTTPVTLTSGQTSPNNDAGIYVPATLSGRVFTDMDADGQRELGDGPVNGVTVRLLDGNGAPTGRTTTTAADGTYTFSGLVPGAYSVEFLRPDGTVFTPANQGNDATDSDADPSNGRTPPVTLLSGGVSENNDAGLYVPAILCGRVWLDWDRDGQRDADEAAVAGVAVRLLDAKGLVVQTGTTAADGTYKFAGLVPATYTVQFIRPDGTAFTLKDVGPDATDSDANPANGRTTGIILVSGDVSRNNDAGLQNLGDQGPCVTEPATKLTAGNDAFNPTPGNDAVSGAGGDDNLHGGAGNDTLFGGDGNDVLIGHEGDDSLTGGAGDDLIHGLAGHDVICMGDGNDNGEGGDGDDVISGGNGNDHFQGEGGDDVLFGDAGDDFVESNEGDDFASGGVGNDLIIGHVGADILVGGADRGTAALVNGHIQVQYGDWIQGNAGADRFVYRPGDGVDLLEDFNPAEGDTLTVYGYSGVVASEIVNGKLAVYFGPNAAVLLPMHYQTGPGGTFPGITFAPDLAAPTTFDQASTLVLLKDGVPFFYGAQGEDAAYGTAAGDLMRGNAGNDWLMGRDGNDTLDGGSGADWLLGGNGTDTVTYAGATAGVAVSLAASPINGTAGDARGDVLIGVENLTGSAYADTMSGDAGANLIDGGAGNDLLDGGAGGDTLLGGAGKDTLLGGLGADVLTGGMHGDTFRWTALAESAPGAMDVVTDFVRGEDRLDLSPIDPKPLVAGDQAFAFVGTAAFLANGTSQVRYVADGADVRVEADADGNGTADFAFLVKGITVLAASDFIL
ncbi:SdrD B-like domain-containing protein [Roseomonas sp. CCTCC AB2023176]|uniref:SdrD B-like domain-containing protein n=1 Tax=Roseomonas sp. CCTCC AB2023176 TaxID=3342640 RepID=UPI0035E30171